MLARFCRIAGCFILAVLFVRPDARAAEQPTAVVHPIWGALPDLRRDDEARQRFVDAAKRHRLGPVQTMDVPTAPEPKVASLLRDGVRATEKLKFEEGQAALNAAAAEVAATGADGLNTSELAELYLFQAMAAQRATWKEAEVTSLQAITPDEARAAYLRAATLAPDRQLEARRFPPLARSSWAAAVAEVRARPRGSLLVRANPNAQIQVNAGQALLSPATVVGLPYGEHTVRVEVPGHEPWVSVVALTEATLEIDVPPTPPLTFADAEAAAQARRMGAAFALIGELEPGPPAQFELRLVDATTGARRDATTVPFNEAERAALDAAVMRLDESARTAVLRAAGLEQPHRPLALATVPAQPTQQQRFGDDPGAWLRRNWPLATAVGVALGTALVLGVAAAGHAGSRTGP